MLKSKWIDAPQSSKAIFVTEFNRHEWFEFDFRDVDTPIRNNFFYYFPILNMNIAPFNSISNLLGYLVIAEDGAVIASNGELENDEKSSEIIHKLITISHR